MSPALQLILILVIILVAAKGSGLLAARLGQPAVLGELIAGVLLGPTALDLFSADFVTDPHLEETVLLLGELGVVFLMFLAGLETDLGEVNRVRRVAILAGTFGVVVPIVTGTGAALPFDISFRDALFLGVVLSATSVSISARTLMELGVLQRRQGIAILAAAVIDDVLVILVLSFFVAFGVEEGGAGNIGDVLVIVGRVLLFFVIALIAGRFVVPWIARWSRNAPMTEGIAVTAIVVMLAFAWFAEYVGEVALITGAFLAGVFLRTTDVHRAIDERFHTLAYAFFVPIFFVSVGLAADASGLEAADLLLLATICIVAVLSKVAGCGLGAYLGGESARSSLQIGTGMVSRGEVGLIVASVGLTHGLLDTDQFSVVVLMVLVTTLVTPVLLNVAFAGEREAYDAQRSRPDPA
jgi:Kef-type K+ transport system membrane component KefB